MALPNIMRRLFRNDGYGPLLKPEIIPFTSDLASRAANVAASTKWVGDAFDSVPLYVDAVNGNDSNDGLTSATAVKTVNRAIVIGSDKVGQDIFLNIAGGTYTENIELYGEHIVVNLLGDVTISGFLFLQYSVFYINDTNNTFTVSSGSSDALDLDEKSLFFAGCPCTLSCSGTSHIIQIYRNSLVHFNKNLTCSASNLTRYAVNIHDNSYFRIDGDLSFSGSSNSGTIYCAFLSFAYFSGDVTVPSGFTGSNTVLTVSNNSSMEFYSGSITLYSNSSNYAIWIDKSSILRFNDCPDIKLYLNYSGVAIISVQDNAIVYFEGSNTNLLLSTNTNPTDFLRLMHNGYIKIAVKTYKCSGTVSYCGVFATLSSRFELTTSTTVTNSLTGTRYRINRCSIIAVGGAGTNRLPGSTNGNTDTATYAIYS